MGFVFQNSWNWIQKTFIYQIVWMYERQILQLHFLGSHCLIFSLKSCAFLISVDTMFHNFYMLYMLFLKNFFTTSTMSESSGTELWKLKQYSVHNAKVFGYLNLPLPHSNSRYNFLKRWHKDKIKYLRNNRKVANFAPKLQHLYCRVYKHYSSN